MKRSLAATLMLLIGGALVLTTVKSATADVPTFKLGHTLQRCW